MKKQEQKRRTKAQTKNELKKLTKKILKLKNDDDIMKNNELNEKKSRKSKKKKLRTNDVFLSFFANYLINNCKFFVRCRNIDLLDFIVFTIICSEHYVKMQILFKCRTHFVRLKVLMLMLYTVRTIKKC
jgi:hypothetical protein